MQAGQTKTDRKASQVARAKARPDASEKRRAKRAITRLTKKLAAVDREAIKKTAASPEAIALHKAVYKQQCEEFEASKVALLEPEAEDTCQ